jgi:protocatechuate 3,4-dioxygenase beta subunit
MVRRDFLLRCASLGGLRVAPPLALAEAAAAFYQQTTQSVAKETAWNEIGPFYKRLAPENPMLRRPGDAGFPLNVTGKVFDTRGHAVQHAKVEIWHSDHNGLYDLDGYRFRATLISDAEGKYHFESVMPGHYPDRVCQHIHYVVTAPGHKPLITQLYFATDPVFEGDPDRNYHRDPLVVSRELVRPVTLTGDPKEMHAAVTFELELEGL